MYRKLEKGRGKNDDDKGCRNCIDRGLFYIGDGKVSVILATMGNC